MGFLRGLFSRCIAYNKHAVHCHQFITWTKPDRHQWPVGSNLGMLEASIVQMSEGVILWSLPYICITIRKIGMIICNFKRVEYKNLLQKLSNPILANKVKRCAKKDNHQALAEVIAVEERSQRVLGHGNSIEWRRRAVQLTLTGVRSHFHQYYLTEL